MLARHLHKMIVERPDYFGVLAPRHTINQGVGMVTKTVPDLLYRPERATVSSAEYIRTVD